MLLLRMNEISKVAQKLFEIQPVFLISHRGVFSKRPLRDIKVLYGELLETREKRRKRLKLNKFDEVSSDSVDENKCWEQDFLLKHAKKNTVQVIPPVKNKTQLSTKNEHKVKKLKMKDENSNDLSSNKMITRQFEYSKFTEEESKVQSSQKSSLKVSDIKTENNSYIVSNQIRPSEIILQNMLSFSIYDSIKSARVTQAITPVPTEIFQFSATEDKSSLGFPSVTRILSATMSEASRKNLTIWKEQMIKKLGIEGFEIYQKNLFQDGHDLHSAIENTLLQKEYEIPERIKPAWESVQNVLKDISSISALETHVVHPKLFYRGIADCVATYRGELCLIDWKKSDKRKDTINSIYDAPAQVASYIGALNADLKYPFEIKKGLVVVAYTSGEEATVYELVQEDLYVYWKAWLRRLQKYFVDSKNDKR